MMAKPIGVMKMIDQGQPDDKIIAVHANDPEYVHYDSIHELPPHRLTELSRFFQEYKFLENKIVSVEEFLDRVEALEVIREAIRLYAKLEVTLRGG